MKPSLNIGDIATTEPLRMYGVGMNRFLPRSNGSTLDMARGDRLLSSALLLLAWVMLQLAPVPRAYGFDTSQDTWALLGGYGQSIPGWGQTTERVETIDLVPRYSHVIFDRIGSGWLEGYYATMVELPLHVVVSPELSSMVAVNFLACYTFTADKLWRPYLFGGGGPVYSFADIPGMGAEWNGNYQFGLGLVHALDATQSLLLEVRYHHISNGGSEEPNVPLNSIKLLVGLTF